MLKEFWKIIPTEIPHASLSQFNVGAKNIIWNGQQAFHGQQHEHGSQIVLPMSKEFAHANSFGCDTIVFFLHIALMLQSRRHSRLKYFISGELAFFTWIVTPKSIKWRTAFVITSRMICDQSDSFFVVVLFSSAFRIECIQRLIIDEWFGLFEFTTDEWHVFFLLFLFRFDQRISFKGKWQKHIGYPNICNQYNQLYAIYISFAATMCQDASEKNTRTHTDLSRVPQSDKFAVCDSHKIPCNWTILKVLAVVRKWTILLKKKEFL